MYSYYKAADYEYAGNRFKAEKQEYISAVGFYTFAQNLSYEIWIDKIAASQVSTPKTRVASGILPQGGYHTIELPSAIGVSPGEEYMVWVKLSGNFYYGHPDKSLALNKSYLVAGGKIYNSEILFGINVYVNQVDYNNYLIINSEQPVNGELSPEDSIISFNDYISKDQGFSKISLKDEKGNELEKSIIINGKDLIIKELPENHINGKLVLLIPKDTLKSTKGQNMYKDYERQFYVYVQASAEVQFKDPILEEIIRSKLNKPTGVIAAGDMRTLIRLDASYCGITNLSGLEYAVKLQYLSLNDNKIISLKLLSCLYELSTLNIQNNYIKDISPLRNLTNLTNLNIMGNAIQDIWPLENLKALKSLNVSNNRISDIYPLHGLRNLTKLDVSANYIKDIYPLKIIAETNNTNLDLNLAENSIDLSDGSEASAILDILKELSVKVSGSNRQYTNFRATALNNVNLFYSYYSAEISPGEKLVLEFNEPISLSENAASLISLCQNDIKININLLSISNKLIITPLDIINSYSFVDLVIGQGALISNAGAENMKEVYLIYVRNGLYGDVDNNKVIDTMDLAAIAQSYNESLENCVTWNERMDINRDGVIDIYDLTIFTSYI